jgi:transcriptional regulator GlxA family with amidase domain
MRLDILVLDGVFDLGLSAVLDTLQTANELIEISGMAVSPFKVRIVGLRKAVRTSQGFSVPVHAAGRGAPDCVVVPLLDSRCPGHWRMLLRGLMYGMPLLRCAIGLAEEQP